MKDKREKLEIQAAAQKYSELALKTLVNVMRTGETDTARITAAKEILDRGYGKSVQAHKLQTAEGNDASMEDLAENAARFTSAVLGLAARGKKK